MKDVMTLKGLGRWSPMFRQLKSINWLFLRKGSLSAFLKSTSSTLDRYIYIYIYTYEMWLVFPPPGKREQMTMALWVENTPQKAEENLSFYGFKDTCDRFQLTLLTWIFIDMSIQQLILSQVMFFLFRSFSGHGGFRIMENRTSAHDWKTEPGPIITANNWSNLTLIKVLQGGSDRKLKIKHNDTAALWGCWPWCTTHTEVRWRGVWAARWRNIWTSMTSDLRLAWLLKTSSAAFTANVDIIASNLICYL